MTPSTLPPGDPVIPCSPFSPRLIPTYDALPTKRAHSVRQQEQSIQVDSMLTTDNSYYVNFVSNASWYGGEWVASPPRHVDADVSALKRATNFWFTFSPSSSCVFVVPEAGIAERRPAKKADHLPRPYPPALWWKWPVYNVRRSLSGTGVTR